MIQAIAYVLLQSVSSTSARGAPAQERAPVLLAVFAHADDEAFVAPALARCAREGAKVQLVIVTRGERWAPTTDLAPGDAIAEVRAAEARCAAEALGTPPPILLAFDDGSLGERVFPPWANLQLVERELRQILAELRPDAVITWGPEGGYGHPDHRLVGALVTQLVQLQVDGAPRRLFFPGMPSDRVPEGPPLGELPWIPTATEFLTVQVPYTDADLEAASRSFACYRSQFPEDALRAGIRQLHDGVWQGRIYFRPWSGGASGEDLFALERR